MTTLPSESASTVSQEIRQIGNSVYIVTVTTTVTKDAVYDETNPIATTVPTTTTP